MSDEQPFSELIENKLNEAYDMAVEHCIELIKDRFSFGGAAPTELVIKALNSLKKDNNANDTGNIP